MYQGKNTPFSLVPHHLYATRVDGNAPPSVCVGLDVYRPSHQFLRLSRRPLRTGVSERDSSS